MFYPHVTISAAQTRESDDLRHATSPFSLFLYSFSGAQRILGYVRPRRIVAVRPPKRWKRRMHLWDSRPWIETQHLSVCVCVWAATHSASVGEKATQKSYVHLEVRRWSLLDFVFEKDPVRGAVAVSSAEIRHARLVTILLVLSVKKIRLSEVCLFILWRPVFIRSHQT